MFKRKATRIMIVGCFVLSLIVSGLSYGASSVWKPNHPITIMVGWAAGGGQDALARALAPLLKEKLGVDVVVNNMPGANGSVAMNYLMREPADGYLLFGYSSAHATYPATGISKYTYKDYQVLGFAQGSYPIFTVPEKSEIKDMNDLIDLWKKGGSTASNTGLGGMCHIPQVVCLNAIGANGKVNFIPYDSGKAAALAVAQQEADWGTSDLVECSAFLKDKMIRPLAVFGDKPVTVEGVGVIPPITKFIPKLKSNLSAGSVYRGIAIKRGAPKNVIKALNDAVKYALNSPDFKKMCEMNQTPALNIVGNKADKLSENSSRFVSWLLYDLKVGTHSPSELGVPRP